MKRRSVMLVTLIAVIVLGPSASAQNAQEFSDPAGQYKLTLIGDWRSVSYKDAVGRDKTEFVFRDRSEGLLRISREALNAPLADMVHQEEESLKIYRAGFERASSEPFGGAGGLSGIRLSFFSMEGGRRMAHTFYYLEEKNGVWVLRFSGKRGVLDAVRNVTDLVARSFKTV